MNISKQDSNISLFQKKLIQLSTITMCINSVVSIFVNAILNLGTGLIILSAVNFVFSGSLFAYSKITGNLIRLRFLFTAYCFIFINYFWLVNYGPNGPAPYVFIIFYCIIIFLWSGRNLFIVSIGLLVNLLTIFSIDILNPSFTNDYDTPTQQVIDVYATIILYIFLIFLIMYEAKESLLKEYYNARKSDQMKSSFIANMSHEIRTPLNAIIGFSEILKRNNLKEEQKELYSQMMTENSQLLLNTINDILDVSKLESDQLNVAPANFSTFELLDTIERTYVDVFRKYENSSVLFNLEKPQFDVVVYSDQVRIQQILVNLIDNAIKFTSKGTITLGATKTQNEITFFIADTGIGIPKELHHQIFDRFYKIENSKKVLYRGTGIGLFLVQRLTHKLQGKVSLSSDIGKGSTFFITLPLTYDSSEE